MHYVHYERLLRLLTLLLMLTTMLNMGMSAQVSSISGRITDASTGEPLPGANILLVGTNRGAASDLAGNYQIENVIPGEYTLRITYIGYRNIEQAVRIDASPVVLNIALETDLLRLDEVVVTALGILREERSIGYSIQSVSGEDLVKSTESNLINALAGKAAGLQITNSSGQPGKSSRITLRGVTSMLGNNQPLFVVDGVPISNDEDIGLASGVSYENPLFTGGASNRGVDIDPNVIQDISILKGASATALYGSRAAGGAIIITTKNAMPGQNKPRISLNSRVGWDDAIIDGFQSSYLQGTAGFYANGIPLSRGGYLEPGYPGTNPQTTLSWGPHKDSVSAQVLNDLGVDRLAVFDPRSQFYKRAMVAENSVNLYGGSQGLNYFVSFSNLNQSGIVPGTKLDRSSLLARFGGRLGDALRVQTSVNYIQTDNTWMGEGNGQRNYLFALNFTPISFDIRDYQWEDGTQRMNTSVFNNPFWLTEHNHYLSNVERIIASTEVEYSILPWLNVTERLSIDSYTDKRKEQIDVGTMGRPGGSMFDQNIDRSELNSDFTISADRRISPDFNMNVLLGHNLNMRNFKTEMLRGTNLNIPGFFHLTNASVVTGTDRKEERRLLSVFSQVVLDYKEYLYLTLTGRNDWSSTLPEDNNSYFYPSASLGFVFTDALGMFENSFLSYGRLRGAISQIGSDAPVYSLATSFSQSNPSDGVRGTITYPFNGINAYQRDNVLGNPTLKPEISTEYEIGLDLRLWEGRARIDVAYYNRSTKDQIFQVPVSAVIGYTSKLTNAGEIRNTGIELSLGGVPLQTRDLSWDFQLNFSKNETEVVELAEGVNSIFLGGFVEPQIRIMPGKKGYGIIWGLRFARDEQGRKLIDDDGYPLLADDLGPIGNVMPDWTANFRSTIRYRGIAVSALFDVRQGGEIMNMDYFYTTFYGTAKVTEDRGTPFVYDGVNVNTGEPNTVEIIRDEFYYRAIYSNFSENFVEDGSFIKLREVSLSYTMPASLMRSLPIQSAQITATGRNLWIKSDFSYGDPEGNLLGSGNAQGFYHMVTPNTKGYSLALSLTL